ncbi:MAG: AAA family ATPase [Muribaculaceae bacterium]|nr:AAA family ATPase [Muribaculaceae bacterium]
MSKSNFSFQIAEKRPTMPPIEDVEFLVDELERILVKDKSIGELPKYYKKSTPSDDDNKLSEEEIAYRKAVAQGFRPGALEELMTMTGLEEVKEAVKRQLAFYKVMERRKKAGRNVPPRLMHTLLIGNPGTGKTTVARLLARIYYEEDIIKEYKFMEHSRGSLVGRYIGTSEERTSEAIKMAKGGVLFIDEIYALAECADGIDQRDFGFKVIDTLMPVLSDPESDVIVIGAGYGKEMKRFIESNSGLSSRFPLKLNFKDFTYEQLIEITINRLAVYDFVLSEAALVKLSNLLSEAMAVKNFGNARLAITVVDNYILPNMCMRMQSSDTDSENGSDEYGMASDVIEAEDVPSLNELFPLSEEKKKDSMGFGASAYL